MEKRIDVRLCNSLRSRFRGGHAVALWRGHPGPSSRRESRARCPCHFPFSPFSSLPSHGAAADREEAWPGLARATNMGAARQAGARQPFSTNIATSQYFAADSSCVACHAPSVRFAHAVCTLKPVLETRKTIGQRLRRPRSTHRRPGACHSLPRCLDEWRSASQAMGDPPRRESHSVGVPWVRFDDPGSRFAPPRAIECRTLPQHSSKPVSTNPSRAPINRGEPHKSRARAASSCHSLPVSASFCHLCQFLSLRLDQRLDIRRCHAKTNNGANDTRKPRRSFRESARLASYARRGLVPRRVPGTIGPAWPASEHEPHRQLL
jgi:hypothetical protein